VPARLAPRDSGESYAYLSAGGHGGESADPVPPALDLPLEGGEPLDGSQLEPLSGSPFREEGEWLSDEDGQGLSQLDPLYGVRVAVGLLRI